MSLVAVGTVAFDNIETPSGRASRVVGGACTYISLTASYFVKPVRIVSVVGDDFPEEMLEYLESGASILKDCKYAKERSRFFGRVNTTAT